MTPVKTAAPTLHLAEVLRMAEDAAITEAFAIAARHCAFALTQQGHHDHAREFEQWGQAKGHEAAEEARRVLRESDSPAERLAAWLGLRSFDTTTRRQQLCELLESHLSRDFPDVAAASDVWLRRGLSPQAACVRTVAVRELDDAGAEKLALWVAVERNRLDDLREVVATADERPAEEAAFEIRARHDFHFRILLGVREEHDLARLQSTDGALAVAIGNVWADAPDDHLGLGKQLLTFAYALGDSPGTRLLNSQLASTPTMHAAANGGRP